MADESEPESKPITVSELIARSENDDAFPRSESVSVRRAGRDDEQAASTTSSGMPSYRTAKPNDATRPPRTVGASGMPSHTPTTEPGPEANAVTGIIPVVSDDPNADTGSLRAVSADDFIDHDLPPVEYRAVAADTASTMHVRADDGPSPFEQTASIPVVSDESTSEAAETAALTDLDPGPGPGTETDLDSDVDSDVDADTDLDEDVESGDGGDPEPTGWAARRAVKADRKAARKSEKAKATAAASDIATEERADDADGDTGARDDAEPSPLFGWLTFVGELVLGLAVGAGLFWGFTELWKSYVYLALVLAVVVIFAIVTFAHVLRKRDLPTTLLALGVGMVVTIGPLVLLAAQP
ncbi:GtrA domain-containing protein [Gordonia sp. MP11Mi]|uniref:Transmembrane protein n=1 Tax=Gordonia sp. MP11Mi TaxID=3022769 RepID=A0AA97CVA9_9ACTN